MVYQILDKESRLEMVLKRSFLNPTEILQVWKRKIWIWNKRIWLAMTMVKHLPGGILQFYYPVFKSIHNSIFTTSRDHASFF